MDNHRDGDPGGQTPLPAKAEPAVERDAPVASPGPAATDAPSSPGYCLWCCNDNSHHQRGECSNCRGRAEGLPCDKHREWGREQKAQLGGLDPVAHKLEVEARWKLRSEDSFPQTETGDAEFFVARVGDAVRYDHRLSRWLLFNEHHWLPQDDGQVDRLVIEAVRERQRCAIGDKKRMAWAIGGEARGRQQHLIQIARSLKPVADAGDGWDADPWLLGVQNGVLDLRTGELRPGRPEDRITKVAPVAYDPRARCARWEQFLGEVFRSCPEVVDYMQRCLGYTLTGTVAEQAFWILWGGGANGKSTMIETFARYVLGPDDYCWTMPFPTAGWSNAMSEYQKAKLDGRRLVLSSEIERRGRLNESLVKSLTGDDTINGRNPYGAPFQYVPVAKFWLRVNDKPVIRDQSHAMWRRVRLVPFLETFSVNTELPKALAAEAPGILAWAVRGSLAWQRDGLREPDVVRVATDEYRAESNPLADFLDERCVLGDGVETRAQILFEQYSRWCQAHQLPETDRLSQRAFGEQVQRDERIKRTEVTTAKSPKRGVWYVGVGLRVEGSASSDPEDGPL